MLGLGRIPELCQLSPSFLGGRAAGGSEGGMDVAHLPLPYLMRMSRLRLSSLPSLNQR